MSEIVTIRQGVQFTPEAANAFQRADAQVMNEFGRHIDVNSTWRSRDEQLSMFNAWQNYVSGNGPYPGHSKALHPDDPLAFHVTGEALDSDDWTIPRIVNILAENGFIRNRLYVPNENHHFEYIRSRDVNYGKDNDMFTDDDRRMLIEAHEAALWSKKRIGGSVNGTTLAKALGDSLTISDWIKRRIGGTTIGKFQSVTDLLGRLINKTEA